MEAMDTIRAVVKQSRNRKFEEAEYHVGELQKNVADQRNTLSSLVATEKEQPARDRDRLDAIRREVHAQVAAKFGDHIFFYDQVGAQLTRLEQRMADLEAKMENTSFYGFHQWCSVLAPSHDDGENTLGAYSPVAPRFPPVLSSSESQEVDAEDLPESMFNYCMQRFAASSNIWYDPALRWWILLFTIQAITLNAFCVVNDLATALNGVTPPDQRAHSTTNCLFSKSDVSGVPFVQWCIGYVAIVMVASIIRADDDDIFRAQFPKVGSGALQWLVRFAWYWQTNYVPGVFGLEAATLFARSADAMEVVMNSLAVTFIMDIDNMLYQNFLSKADKDAYQQRAGLPFEDPTLAPTPCSWAIFAANILIMGCLYTHVLGSIGRASFQGDAWLNYLWRTIPLFYVLSFGSRSFLQRVFSNPRHTGPFWTRFSSGLPGSLGEATIVGLLGPAIYFFGLGVSANRFLLPPYVYFDASEFLACDE